MATLTAKKRNALPKSSFALSGGRYPIHDAAHARNALARVAQHGTPREQAIVRAAVKRRYPDIGQGGQSSGSGDSFGASKPKPKPKAKGVQHSAMISARFKKKAASKGTSLSAAQLALLDLAIEQGVIDLAGMPSITTVSTVKGLTLPKGSRVRVAKDGAGRQVDVHYKIGKDDKPGQRVGTVTHLGNSRFQTSRHVGTYGSRQEAHDALTAPRL